MESASPPPPYGRKLAWALGLTWVLLHLLGMAAQGFALGAPHAFLWGGASPEAVRRHGALVPLLVEQGEIQRLLTGAGYLGQGLLSLLLGLWIGLSSLAFLERRVGFARALLALGAATLVGALVRTGLNAGSELMHAAGWDLIMGSVGARIPWGFARGGPEGRTAISGALAFAALSALLTYVLNDGNLEPLRGQGAAFAAGILALALLRPSRAQSPPGPLVRGLAAAVLLAMLAAVGVQARQALADPGTASVRALLTSVDDAEDAARRLWDERRNPAHIPASERAELGRLIDLVLEHPSLSGLTGEPEARAFVQSFTPLVTGDLRDPSLAFVRMKRAAKAWQPFEERLRARHMLGTPERAPWR